jgi:PsbP
MAVFTLTIMNPFRQITGQTNGTSGFITYTDPALGYSIQYPSDWHVSHYDPVSPKDIAISNREETASFLIHTNDSIVQNTTIQDVANALKQQVSHFGTGNASVDFDTDHYHVAGRPTLRIEQTFDDFNPILGQIKVKDVTLKSILNEKGYDFSMSAPSTKFSDYSPIFGYMLNSFRLPNGQ